MSKFWDGLWQGVVIDRMTQEECYRSKPVTTWEEAARRANITARRKGGERYSINVVDYLSEVEG